MEKGKAPNGRIDVTLHQFKVALSFPGEFRPYVRCVAKELKEMLGPNACFFDEHYTAQLARPNLHVLLHDIYGDRSDLVVVFVCAEYERKEWCGIEWDKISERRIQGGGDDIMYVRVGEGEVSGMTKLDGYVDAKNLTSKDVALMVEERVMVTEESTSLAARQHGERAARRTINEASTTDNLSVEDLEKLVLKARTLEVADRLNVKGGWQVAEIDKQDIATVVRDGHSGLTPLGDSYHSSWTCYTCLSPGPWNGNLCMNCGTPGELD